MFVRVFSHNYLPDNLVPSRRLSQLFAEWRAADPSIEIEVVCTFPFFPDGKVRGGYKGVLTRETIDGINVVHVWALPTANRGTILRSISFLTFAVSAFFYALCSRRPDVVLATTPQLFAATSGALYARMCGVPCVIEVRDLWPESIGAVFGGGRKWLSWPLLAVARFTYRSADLLVTVSRAFDSKLSALVGYQPRFHYAPNGVRFSKQAESSEGLTDGGRGVDSSTGQVIFGYAGNIGMAHKHEILVEAVQELVRKGYGEKFQVKIFGDGAERANLEKTIQLARVERWVCLKAPVPYSQIGEVYRQFDACLVFLRKSEVFEVTIPSKLFECLAMAKPVLLGVVGEAARILLEAKAGYLFEPENPIDMADKMAGIIDGSKDSLKVMGELGQSYVAQNFNVSAIAQSYMLGLKELLSSRQRDTRKHTLQH